MKNKEKNFISVVVYIHNSNNSIQNFLSSIDALLEQKFESYEFILVNDSSIDDSIDRVKKISNKLNGNVTVIDLAWRHGIELAMLSGVELAIGDFIFEFDSPNIDYKLDEIMNLYNKCLEGYDIVAASPLNSSKWSSKMFYTYLNKISYKNMKLMTETFRVVSRRALNRVLSCKEKLRYRKASYHYSGFQTNVIKYNPIEGKKVRHDMKFRDKINLASDILISASNIGIKLASKLSFIFLTIALLMLGYTFYSYFNIKDIEPGWTTIMLFLSFSFCGLFFILAILAKYLTVIMLEVQDKPTYIYKSVDKFSNK